MKNILLLNQELYEQVIRSLNEAGKTDTAELLVTLKQRGEIKLNRQLIDMTETEAKQIAQMVWGDHAFLAIEFLPPYRNGKEQHIVIKLDEKNELDLVIYDTFDMEIIALSENRKYPVPHHTKALNYLIRQGFDVFADRQLPVKTQTNAIETPVTTSPPAQITGGYNLNLSQIEIIKVLRNGGKLQSLRWKDDVFCNIYDNGNASNVVVEEVEALLEKKLIVGIVQYIFPDKEYELTELGKTVKI